MMRGRLSPGSLSPPPLHTQKPASFFHTKRALLLPAGAGLHDGAPEHPGEAAADPWAPAQPPPTPGGQFAPHNDKFTRKPGFKGAHNSQLTVCVRPSPPPPPSQLPAEAPACHPPLPERQTLTHTGPLRDALPA